MKKIVQRKKEKRFANFFDDLKKNCRDEQEIGVIHLRLPAP